MAAVAAYRSIASVDVRTTVYDCDVCLTRAQEGALLAVVLCSVTLTAASCVGAARRLAGRTAPPVNDAILIVVSTVLLVGVLAWQPTRHLDRPVLGWLGWVGVPAPSLKP